MKVAVLGAGIAGLAAGIAFARAGHQVSLVEKDASPTPERPEDSFLGWDRPGVPQRRLVHGFIPVGRKALRAGLPDIADRLYAVGANDVDLLDALTDREAVAGDEDLVILRCRRTVFEWTLRRAALEHPGVRLLSGEVATGFTAIPAASTEAPAVNGVKLRSGGVLAADLVVDAMGRASNANSWLTDLGAPRGMGETRQPCGVIYYTRFYERHEAGFPAGFRAQLGYGLISASAADGRTFDITFFVRAEEPGLRGLRHEDAFERAVNAIPGLKVWRDGGRPIGPVAVMGALENCLRHPVDGGRLCARGLILVGDALSITNPTLGRGMSLAFHQAIAAGQVDWKVGDLEAGAAAYHARVLPLAEASFADAVEADLVATEAYAGKATALAHPRTLIGRAIPLAAATDPELFRAIVRHSGLLDPPGALFAEPWISRARALLATSPPPTAGPDLDGMLAVLEG